MIIDIGNKVSIVLLEDLLKQTFDFLFFNISNNVWDLAKKQVLSQRPRFIFENDLYEYRQDIYEHIQDITLRQMAKYND